MVGDAFPCRIASVGEMPSGGVCFRLPNIFRRGDAFLPEVAFSLTTYYLGAFRAPAGFVQILWRYHPPRGTFVNSDKSTQKRRNPYGFDPLWVCRACSGSAFGYTFTGRSVCAKGKSCIGTWVADCRALAHCFFVAQDLRRVGDCSTFAFQSICDWKATVL